MIITDLLRLEWKKTVRTKNFYKNLAVSIFLGIFAIYMAVLMLILGFALPNLLEKVSSTLKPTEIFNGMLFYGMMGGIMLRFVMQPLNTFDLQPYQILPLKRNLLVNFVLIKPLFNPINFFPFFVVIPFVLRSTIPYYSIEIGVRLAICVMLITWSNSLIVSYLKRKFGSGFFIFLIMIVITAGIGAVEYCKWFSLFNASKAIFGLIVFKSYGIFALVILLIFSFSINKIFFYHNFYAENFNRKLKDKYAYNSNLTFLNRFGTIGEIMAVKIKLIIRHKRTKGILYMGIFFLFYGLIFYPQKSYENHEGMLFFVAMFITGLLMLMFGQWAYSWDSRHFDSILTLNIPTRSYVMSNYYLMVAFTIISFILTTPYFFFGTKIMYMHIAALLYNLGVNVNLLLYFATYNTKKVDLSKGSAMNYQGTTYKSFVVVMPIMFFPMALTGLLSTFFTIKLALWCMTILGTIGLIFQKPILSICEKKLIKRKYIMSEGYREND